MSKQETVAYGFPEDDEYLRKRIHDILQQEIDMGVDGKLIRGGMPVGGVIVGGMRLEREMLEERGIKELKKDAKDLKIKGYSRMSKKKLIDAIMEKPIHDGEISEGYHPFIEKGRDIRKFLKMEGGSKRDVEKMLHKLTVKELKKIAKKMKLKGYSSKKKSELVMMLAKYAD